MEYTLTSRDLNEISLLLNVATMNININDRLAKLELWNQAKSLEYKNTIEEKKLALDLENQYYKNANLNASKMVAWLKYLKMMKMPKDVLSLPESIASQDYSFNHVRRMNHVLSSYICNPFMVSDMPKATRIIREIENTIDLDIYSAYLTLIDELINKPNYLKFREALIKSKYYVMAIHRSLERDLGNNDFNISSDILESSKLVADFYGVDSNTYNQIKNKHITLFALTMIDGLLICDDKSYIAKENLDNALLRQNLIMACLAISSHELVVDLKNKFYSFLTDPDYLKTHARDNFSKGLIQNAFETTEANQKKVKIVSLNLG